jgi:hypothetical protein
LPQGIPQEYWERKGVELNFGGGFVAGVGKYSAKILLVDAEGRACRDNWKFKAPETKTPIPVPAGEIRPNLLRWEGIPKKASEDRVTIFLHAAPLYARRNCTQLRSWDKAVLLGSLTSFLNVSKFAKARVIVFNLDARKILYEADDFQRADFVRLSRALDRLEMGTINIKTLTQSNEASFLAEVLRRELDVPLERERGRAAIFLGPTWRWSEKLDPLLQELRPQLPPATYLSLTSMFRNSEDILYTFVKAGKGKVIEVFAPLDLAKAIRQIDEKTN